MLDDGHLILGKGAGLVGADGLRAAEGLDGRKLADNRLALGHLGHAERKHDGHDGDQALGNGGDGERDRDHKGVEQGSRIGKDVAHAVTDDVDAKDHDADDDHHDGEDAAELESFTCSGVSSSLASARAPAILPISVSMPVPTTTARPRPYTTVEPI